MLADEKLFGEGTFSTPTPGYNNYLRFARQPLLAKFLSVL
jgi:hypothetical protein